MWKSFCQDHKSSRIMKANLTRLVECLHSTRRVLLVYIHTQATHVFHVHLGNSRYDNILKKRAPLEGEKKKALKARGWVS